VDGGPCERFAVGGAITCPGDHAVGPDEYGSASEVVSRRPGHMADPALAARRRTAPLQQEPRTERPVAGAGHPPAPGAWRHPKSDRPPASGLPGWRSPA